VPINISEDPEKNRLVNESKFAFLIAMLLDQQISIKWAFEGPNRIAEKLSKANPELAGTIKFIPEEILDFSEQEFINLIIEKPTIHRYPKAMAKRIYALAAYIQDNFAGETEQIWKFDSGEDVLKSLKNLPGFGSEKSKITLAVLCKRFGYNFTNWQEICKPFSDSKPRTVADAKTPEDYKKIVEWKKLQKSLGLEKSE